MGYGTSTSQLKINYVFITRPVIFQTREEPNSI